MRRHLTTKIPKRKDRVEQRLKLFKMSTDPDFRTKKKESAEFSSWVIGGQYNKSNLKRSQAKQAKEVPLPDSHRQHIEARKQELQAALDSFGVSYKQKLVPSTPESNHAQKRASPPRRPVSPPKEQEEGTDDNSSTALRGRLKASFAQITTTHAYGTLFPPLLTPYNRPCLLGIAKSDGTNHLLLIRRRRVYLPLQRTPQCCSSRTKMCATGRTKALFPVRSNAASPTF